MDRAGTESGRGRTWARAHRGLVDAGLALALWLFLVLLQVGTSADATGGLSTWAAYAIIGTAQIVPLAWRRRHPGTVFALVSVATLISGFAHRQLAASDLAFLFALYAVAAFETRRWVRVAGLGVGFLGAVAATVLWTGPDTGASTLARVVTGVTSTSVVVVLVWLWGTNTRHRRERLDSLHAHNAALVRERDQLALLAAQEERARIARDLHDIVAHSLSVIVVQADGAAYAAQHQARWTPDDAAEALTTIAATAREALSDTRSLVGVLRTGDDDGQLRPQPSLEDVPALVDRVRASGHDVVLEFAPDVGEIRRNAGLTAYRVVQEGLTNVLRHAGPAARSTVAVGGDTDTVVVSITDDGRGAAAGSDGTGHGLIGLQERIGAVGGSLTFGPRPGGGYALVAQLPVTHGPTYE